MSRLTLLSFLLPLLLMHCAPQPASWQPAPGPLLSKFAADVNPDNPWPEYPRPMMVREDWLSLNGLWDFAIAEREADRPASMTRKILVPYPVESALSGIGERVDENQRLWYRRTIEVPAAWSGRRLLLHFEAVDWETKAWIDGVEVGTHRGGYDPFSFEITDLVTAGGDHELVVSVWDPTDAGPQPRGKQVSNPSGIWYTPSSGIWQTVWLEAVPQAYLSDYRAIPDIDAGTLTILPETNAAETGFIVRAVASTEGAQVAEAEGPVDQPLVLSIPEPTLWEPENPFLYDLRLSLMRDGEEVDAVDSYFGMRKTSLGKDENGKTRLFLNNRFVFQNGPLDQGFWPDGLYAPPTDEAMRYDLEVTKAMGFNMLRKHVKVEPRRFYTWADQMGLLVWQDMPSGDDYIGLNDPDIVRSPESAAQFELELRQMILTKFNHPSIVMWVPFNEGWGQYDSGRIVDLIRSIDPTRLVNHASGWADRGVGDVNDIHRYPAPGAVPPEPNRAAVLGEFGGLGLAMPGHTWEAQAWGYQQMADTLSLLEQYEDFYGTVAGFVVDPGLSAVVYTQTTDVETETNGLMTYDRAVIKMAPDAVRRAHLGFVGPRLVNPDRIFLDAFQVDLRVPVPGSSIRYRLDGGEPGPEDVLYGGPFDVTESVALTARAFWPNGETSRVTRFEIRKVVLRPPDREGPLEPGLNARLYSGSWRAVPDFSAMAPDSSWVASTIGLTDIGRTVDFGAVWEGYVEVPATGMYRFYTSSDDGSLLFIGDDLVVDNDGTHGDQEKSGPAALEAGLHPIRVAFFQGMGGYALRVSIEGPGLPKQEIGPKMLFRTNS